MRRTTVVATLAVLIAASLGLTVGLRAQGPEFRPPRIAFLDIHRVIENYERSRRVEKDLGDKAEAIRNRVEAEMNEIRKEDLALDKLSSASSDYAAKKEAVELKKYKLQYWAKQEEQKVRREAREEMVSIYREIQNAVERYAAAVGLEAVLLVSRGELPGETLPEVKFQIAVRPVLFCTEGLDVTEPILSILNGK